MDRGELELFNRYMSGDPSLSGPQRKLIEDMYISNMKEISEMRCQ